MRPAADIDVCCVSHRALLATLAPLTDDDFRSLSKLPGFSRAHVVTHLANKAKAHVWVFEGPPADEIRRLHPDGYDAGVAAGAGAGRSAVELRADLERSFELLEAAWRALDDALWNRQGIMMAGPRTMSEIVAHHLRDVVMDHVDLDLGYRPSDWP